VYKTFSDPFYYGQFEYPKGSGQWYQGSHEPMITEAEFKRVQRILHRSTNPRPHKEFLLPYRGILKCGECGSSITAHFKEQVRCSDCGYKSSVKNIQSCSKCRLPISSMKAPKIRRYAYYHCTRTLNASCRQKCISASALEKQVAEKLKPFGLPPELRDWGLGFIEKLRTQKLKEKEQILAERKKAHDQCVVRLENLVRLKTAPNNSDGSLLSDEEYQKQRAALLAEKAKLSTDTLSLEAEVDAKARVAKETLDLATTIESSLNGDSQKKRELLSALGLNHALKEKELEIRPDFPFSELPRRENQSQSDLTPIEPENTQGGPRQNGHFIPARPSLERDTDKDRTKSLKTALEVIWKRIDPSSPIFKRFPFDPEAPIVSIQPRGIHRTRLLKKLRPH
jgi:hypothetical protein